MTNPFARARPIHTDQLAASLIKNQNLASGSVHDVHTDQLVASLIAWFTAERRALPWRTDRTAYRVWLSEVMLQQTRVSVVIDYFERFVARFPDVDSLARANEDDVLALWSGLGYYSRGRNLHRAARAVVALGGFPTTAAGLRSLPGVGPYTAAAIASLAFGEPIAVVDGNVLRVLSRLFDDHAPIDAPATVERMRARAQRLCVAGDAAAVNEGLMELGALICTKGASAQCDACPWRSTCAARAAGTVALLPKKGKRTPRREVRVASVVLHDGPRLWLERRASGGLFGGLYQPPSEVLADDDDASAAFERLLRARDLAVPAPMPAAISVERTLTHRVLRFAAVAIPVDANRLRSPLGAWHDGLEGIGVSSAVRAVLDAVRSSEAPRRVF